MPEHLSVAGFDDVPRLARKYPEDRESYTAGKDRFIERVIESAQAGR